MQRCTIFSNSGCKVIKKTLTSKYFSPFFVSYPKRIHQKAYIKFHLEQLYRLFVYVMGYLAHITRGKSVTKPKPDIGEDRFQFLGLIVPSTSTSMNKEERSPPSTKSYHS